MFGGRRKPPAVPPRAVVEPPALVPPVAPSPAEDPVASADAARARFPAGQVVDTRAVMLRVQLRELLAGRDLAGLTGTEVVDFAARLKLTPADAGQQNTGNVPAVALRLALARVLNGTFGSTSDTT